MRKFIARSIRAAQIIVRDERIPRPLRAFAALALLPIPGPFDEAVLLLVAPILFVFYRDSMRGAWERAFRQPKGLDDPRRPARGAR